MADNEPKQEPKQVTRREFVTGIGGAGAGALLGGLIITGLSRPNEAAAMPPSEGYIVVDKEKCASCNSCMIACSLAHEGKVSLSNSRIQVVRDVFADFPNDIIQ